MLEPKLRVLFIDDCEPSCRAIRRVLREHEITCATSARAALALIVGEAQHFDAILCDLHMPGTTGEDFFHVLSSVRPLDAAHLIFMTGDPRAGGFLEGTGTECLRKPFTGSAVRAAIQRVVPAAA